MPSADFPRKQRLTKPTEFKRVFERPVVSSDRYFKILARANERVHPRLGMAVSRQVDRKAPGRNRIKRVIRESFRHWVSHGAPGMDIVVLPRRETATICNRQLFQSLSGHWSKLEKRLEG